MTRLILLLFILLMIGFGVAVWKGIGIKESLIYGVAIAGMLIVIVLLATALVYKSTQTSPPSNTTNYFLDPTAGQFRPGRDPRRALSAPNDDVVEGQFRDANVAPLAGPNDRIVRQKLPPPKIIGGWPTEDEDTLDPSPRTLTDDGEVERHDWEQELPFEDEKEIEEPKPEKRVATPTSPAEIVEAFIESLLDDEFLVLDRTGRVPAGYLYEEMFAEWCAATGTRRLSLTMFGRVMNNFQKEGWPQGWRIWKEESAAGRFYCGIKEPEEEV